MNISVNYLSVLLAGISSMVVGFIYYSQYVMGKPWMKAMGYTADGIKKAQKEMGKLYGISFVLSLITSYVLFHIMTLSQNFFHYSKLTTGLSSAFWIWLGFVMPVQLTGEIFGGKKWKAFAINTGYQLVALLVMGIVLSM